MRAQDQTFTVLLPSLAVPDGNLEAKGSKKMGNKGKEAVFRVCKDA